MRFSYQKYRHDPNPAFPSAKWISRPVIPLELVNKDGRPFRYDVLIDSGADYNIFHAEVGESLGLDVPSGKPLEFFGVTGDKQKAFFHKIEVGVGGHPHKIYCGFARGFKNLPYGLLGQDDFFKIYSVRFTLQKKLIELKEVKKK